MSDLLRLIRDGACVLIIGLALYYVTMALLPEKKPYEICGTYNVLWDPEIGQFRCPDNWGA